MASGQWDNRSSIVEQYLKPRGWTQRWYVPILRSVSRTFDLPRWTYWRRIKSNDYRVPVEAPVKTLNWSIGCFVEGMLNLRCEFRNERQLSALSVGSINQWFMIGFHHEIDVLKMTNTVIYSDKPMTMRVLQLFRTRFCSIGMLPGLLVITLCFCFRVYRTVCLMMAAIQLPWVLPNNENNLSFPKICGGSSRFLGVCNADTRCSPPL